MTKNKQNYPELKTTLDWARFYVTELKWSVIPIAPRDKKPAYKWKDYQKTLPTDTELVKWFAKTSNNVGIVTGALSGISVVDFDSKEAFESAKEEGFVMALVAKTPRGYHSYYQYKAGSRNFQNKDIFPDVDYRSEGGYVVAPPSFRSNDESYTWLNNTTPDAIKLPEVPDELIHWKPEQQKPIEAISNGVSKGERNQCLTRLVGNWITLGHSAEECIQKAEEWDQLNKPPLNNQKELLRPIRSIWNKHYDCQYNEEEFARFARFATTASDDTQSQNDENPKNTQSDTDYFPEHIYSELPFILNNGASAFTDRREKDLFLHNGFVISSGCLPNVWGVYDGRIVYPNLYGNSISPPANGKGAMRSSADLGNEYHKFLKETISTNPKRLFIPANISSARMYKLLKWNDGNGTICETETDTLTNTWKNEWGAYSDMLRKAFHHEPISISRMRDNEDIEITEPKISLALTGTPNQFYKLIGSIENGLFSRFMYYYYRETVKWHDVSPLNKRKNLTEHFSTLSMQVLEMAQLLKNSPTEIKLSPSQWELINVNFAKATDKISSQYGNYATSITKRLGLILYRIAMILTSLRKFEQRGNEKEMLCSNTDFKIAFELIKVYHSHGLELYQALQDSDNTISTGPTNKDQFFKALPSEFARAYAVKVGTQFQIPKRTVDSTLKQWTGNKLVQPKTGYYKKIQP